MLRFCGDESGINPESKVCIVAGFLGEVDQWESLERAWMATLRKYGLDCFHAIVIFARGKDRPLRSPYKEWGNERTDEFLTELIRIINDHEIKLVGSAVVKEDFYDLNQKERRLLTGATFNHKKRKIDTSGKPNHPYFAGLAFAIQHTTKVEPSGDVIEFMMDRQAQYSRWAVDWYHEWEETAPPDVRGRLGGLSFRDKCRFVGLQSADLVAHLWNRHFNSGLTGTRLEAMELLTAGKAKEERRILQINSGVMRELIDRFPQDTI